MTKIYVNGRFLGRTMTGVERFAFMVLDRVHARIVSGAEPARWTLLLPPGVEKPVQWTGFAAKNVGSRGGHFWEQATLPGAARDGVLVNLCNSGPVLPRRSLTVIHDALVYDMPGNFSRPYRLLHQSLGWLLSRRSHLGTVSMFSRDRLSAVLKVPADAIPVIPNAADHIDAIAPDDTVMNALDVERGRYLLFVGSFAPNKNLPRALEAFARIRRPEDRLVLVGAAVRSFAQNGLGDEPPEGVVLPGRISDAALMSLYRSARALVFPSLYEGFGIPPLEAMRFGRPVIAGDIPPVREVCGDAALYCDPKSVEAIATAMQTMLRDDAVHADLAGKVSARSRQFSWDASADALLRALKAV